MLVIWCLYIDILNPYIIHICCLSTIHTLNLAQYNKPSAYL